MERLHVCKAALVSAAVVCFLISTSTDSLTVLGESPDEQDNGNGGCWIGVWRTTCFFPEFSDPSRVAQHSSTNSAPIGDGSGQAYLPQMLQILAIVFGAVTAVWSVGVLVCAQRKTKRLLSWRCCLGVLHLLAACCGVILPFTILAMGNACQVTGDYGSQLYGTRTWRAGLYVAALGGVLMLASSLVAFTECCVGIDELYQTMRQPESRGDEAALDVDLKTIASGTEDTAATNPPEGPYGYGSLQAD